jgi:hypothetical protein
MVVRRPQLPEALSIERVATVCAVCAIGVLVALVALTACGSTTVSGTAARRAAARGGAPCPETVEDLQDRGPVPGLRPLLARDPLAGELCMYATAGKRRATLRARVILTAASARTLALLLDARGGSGPSCDVGQPVLVRLRYEGGRQRSDLAGGCDPERLLTRRGAAVLAPIASAAVGGLLALVPAQGRLVRTPELVGRPFAAAARAARGYGGVTVGEVIDPSSVTGTVVWQVPLAGAERTRSDSGISVIVAVRRSARCRGSELRGHYVNGGLATQGHFGAVVLAAASPRPCSLAGPLRLGGLTAAGRLATGIVTIRLRRPVVLTPSAGAARFGLRGGGGLVATLGFAGETDGPPFTSRAACAAREVHPARWELELPGGGRLEIANGRGGRGFYSCGGNLVRPPGQGLQLSG